MYIISYLWQNVTSTYKLCTLSIQAKKCKQISGNFCVEIPWIVFISQTHINYSLVVILICSYYTCKVKYTGITIPLNLNIKNSTDTITPKVHV